MPEELFGGRLKDSFLLDLEVVAIRDAVPMLRTIVFRSSDLVDFAWQPGQDVMLTVPGAGPFARWAAAASVGDRIDGIGPRGVITLRDDSTTMCSTATSRRTPCSTRRGWFHCRPARSRA